MKDCWKKIGNKHFLELYLGMITLQVDGKNKNYSSCYRIGRDYFTVGNYKTLREAKAACLKALDNILEELTISALPKETVYKCFCGDGKNLVSSSIYIDPFHYELHKWNKPQIPNSKFFVFLNKKDAYKFYNLNAVYVYQCEAVGVIQAPRHITTPSYREEFWKKNDWKYDEGYLTSDKDRIPAMASPEGTFWCDKVKLIKEVDSL